MRIGANSFYGALFADFDPEGGVCPWLERGAYLNIDGDVNGCCFMKSSTSAFGNVTVHSAEAITAARRTLSNELRAGVVPEPCKGCGVAATVTGQRQPRALVVVD